VCTAATLASVFVVLASAALGCKTTADDGLRQGLSEATDQVNDWIAGKIAEAGQETARAFSGVEGAVGVARSSERGSDRTQGTPSTAIASELPFFILG
jgi:hypothetical protein